MEWGVIGNTLGVGDCVVDMAEKPRGFLDDRSLDIVDMVARAGLWCARRNGHRPQQWCGHVIGMGSLRAVSPCVASFMEF